MGEEVAAKKPHAPRNYKLPGGVYKYSKSQMYKKRGLWKIKKDQRQEKAKPVVKPRYVVKTIGGEKNGGTRLVRLVKERRYYPTEDKPKKKHTRKITYFSQHKRRLRSSITPGTVLILVAGPHRGKRVIFLKQLKTGLLLVTGPFRANRCPLRRVHQNYVIATQTKIDLSEVKIPDHIDDRYFKRAHPKKKVAKKEEGGIFDTKPEGYVPSEQRKKDQIEVDKQVLGAIKKHPEYKLLYHYLRARFSLRNGMYPHKLIF